MTNHIKVNEAEARAIAEAQYDKNMRSYSATPVPRAEYVRNRSNELLRLGAFQEEIDLIKRDGRSFGSKYYKSGDDK